MTISTLAQALSQIRRINVQQSAMSRLATQLATGKKTQEFAGLGNDIIGSQRARSSINSIDVYINNIKHADIRMSLMLQTINEFKAQSENFAGSMTTFVQEGSHQKGDIIYYDNPLTPEDEHIAVGMSSAEPDIDFETMRELAENLFNFLADLVNTKDVDRFVLGGGDSRTKPMGNTSLLDSAVTSLISDWKDGTISTDDLIASINSSDSSEQPRALTDSIIGYSDALSAGNVADVSVRTSESTEIKYTALANDKSIRNIFVGLAIIKNATLSPIVDTYTPPNAPPAAPDISGAPGATMDEMQNNFYAMFNNITQMVNAAIDDMDTMRFGVESARARAIQFKERHEDTLNLLLNTVSDIEDVDISETAVRINSLQIQLEASYAVTAENQRLSLVNYIR